MWWCPRPKSSTKPRLGTPREDTLIYIHFTCVVIKVSPSDDDDDDGPSFATPLISLGGVLDAAKRDSSSETSTGVEQEVGKTYGIPLKVEMSDVTGFLHLFFMKFEGYFSKNLDFKIFLKSFTKEKISGRSNRSHTKK